MLSRERLEKLAKQEPCDGECTACEPILMARALRWRPITETDLPTMQDEVGRWLPDGRFETGSVGAMGAADVWRGRGWTHFRPIAPPTDTPKEEHAALHP